MATTKDKYHNPSVNIIRDIEREIAYLPTSNAQLVFDEILNFYIKGTRSFNIVGAYGTGKSSFLWALEKTLNKKNLIFNNSVKAFKNKEYKIIPIVGEYTSIIKVFSEYLGIQENATSSEVIKAIKKLYSKLEKEGKGLLILIDEFGKFLEYASLNLPESELYFLQLLSEFVNDVDKEVLFVTTLHQGFNSYAQQLTSFQRQEWDKVSGRFAELAFNEPVEQLLIIAAEKLNKAENKIYSSLIELFEIIKKTKTFPLKFNLDLEICRQLLPFDLVAAGVMTIALQRYGQNQRSLFSFIDSSSHLSINNFDNASNPLYNLACVYDYLNFNYYSFLFSKSNPDYFHWASISNALEKCEGAFQENIAEVQKLIKTIGLLFLFANKGATVDKEFLEAYSEHSLGIKKVSRLIKELETNNIIRFSNYNHRYKLAESTDLNLEFAIDAAGNLIQQAGNVVEMLEKHFDFPYILAKEAFYQIGTPRFFEFTLSDNPQNNVPEGEIDGYLNLIFSETLTPVDLELFSKNVSNAVLYGLYGNTSQIKKLILDIEKVQKVIDDNKDDTIAVKELNAILEHNKVLLNHYILDNLYNSHSVTWYYKGEKIQISGTKELNHFLSRICNDVYSSTPILKNELFNKTKISSNISIARRSFIEKLVNQNQEEDLGFDSELFPPEKTIYLSLLKKTGIHVFNGENFILQRPNDRSFDTLWDIDTRFIESARLSRRKLTELISRYQAQPIKLKQGFIDFWLPVFLVVHKSEFALYGEGIYIPDISPETIDLILKKPENYEIKSFDLDSNKLKVFNQYRTFLNQIEESQPTNQSFIETIKPFLVFYRLLSPYSLQTHKVSKKAIALREVLALATDPEKTIFEDLPRVLGYNFNDFVKSDSKIEEFIIQLKDCIQELNSANDNLIDRFEAFIISKISNKPLHFIEYKNLLIDRFSKIKKHLLSTKQKALLQRIKSPLDERKSWLNSLSFAVIGKSLEQITDQDEKVLHDLFVENLRELDNLCEISKSDVDEEKEEVFKIEITSFVKGLEKRLVRLPKQDKNKIHTLEQELRSKLEQNDRDFNIAVLTELLQEQLKND